MAKIQLKRGTSAKWTQVNPILSAGEPGFETDTKKFKIGDGSTAWSSLPYSNNTEAGEIGADGREVQLQNNGTHIQWKYEDEVSWTNLVALSAITGAQGIQGEQGLPGEAGATGANGDDGRQVEFQKSATHIQWRYVGDATWIDLVPLSELLESITIDETPTSGSTNPVESDGVFTALSGKADGIQGFYKGATGLRRFRQSLGLVCKTSAGAGLGGIDIICFGDSIIEGYSGTDVNWDSAIHHLKVKLQTKYNPSGVIGGYGYMPITHGNGNNALWTSFGTVSNGTANLSVVGRSKTAAFGANGMYVRLNGAEPAWKRMAASAVQLIGYKAGSHGTARWDTGVGAAPTIGSGVQTGTHNQLYTPIPHSGERYGNAVEPAFTAKIDLTASDDNYIQWAAPSASSNASYDGIIAYNGDFDCGVRLHTLGYYGKKIGEQLPFILDQYNSGINGRVVTWGRGLKTGGACNAKLYIMNWISNDCGYSATPSTALATFKTQYEQAVDYVLALASKPSVLLVIPPRASSVDLNNRTTEGTRHIDFVNAIYEIADARDHVAILDIDLYLDRGGVAGADFINAGWNSDHVHLSSAGQYAMADLMYTMLTE